MRSLDFFELLDKRDDGDGLDRLAETHVVSKNSVNTALVQRYHPIKSHQLIVLEVTTLKDGGLFSQSGEGFFFMLFFLNDVVNLFFFLIKVPSSFGFPIDAFLHDFMF
jgi:hypothetical protein